jgi:hypothetical protein
MMTTEDILAHLFPDDDTPNTAGREVCLAKEETEGDASLVIIKQLSFSGSEVVDS